LFSIPVSALQRSIGGQTIFEHDKGRPLPPSPGLVDPLPTQLPGHGIAHETRHCGATAAAAADSAASGNAVSAAAAVRACVHGGTRWQTDAPHGKLIFFKSIMCGFIEREKSATNA